jgi:hypothetical protein
MFFTLNYCRVIVMKFTSKNQEGRHTELVEVWWVGLCARSFDKLRMTSLFLIIQKTD